MNNLPVVAIPPKPAMIPSHNIYIDTVNILRLFVNDWDTGDRQKICKIGHQLEHIYSHQIIGGSSSKGSDEIVFTI
jgi:hypothetical protein